MDTGVKFDVTVICTNTPNSPVWFSGDFCGREMPGMNILNTPSPTSQENFSV